MAINAEKLESAATIREKSVSPTNDRSVPLVSTCSNTPGYNTAFSFTILESVADAINDKAEAWLTAMHLHKS